MNILLTDEAKKKIETIKGTPLKVKITGYT